MTNLNTMTRAALTELHNNYVKALHQIQPGSKTKPVKIFKDHPTAVARTEAIIKEVTKLRDDEHKAPKISRAKADRPWKGPRITEDYQPVRGNTRLPRSGSTRAVIFNLLKTTGANWETIWELVNESRPESNRKTLETRSYRFVLDMWYQFGHGIKQDGDTGIITIYR